VLVVLTKPVAFESGEDLEPVSLESLPACGVVYIRYRAPVQSASPFDRQMGGRARGALFRINLFDGPPACGHLGA